MLEEKDLAHNLTVAGSNPATTSRMVYRVYLLQNADGLRYIGISAQGFRQRNDYLRRTLRLKPFSRSRRGHTAARAVETPALATRTYG